MYFISQGWELYVNGGTTEGEVANGFGAIDTTSYWILRKPCTKEVSTKPKKKESKIDFIQTRMHQRTIALVYPRFS